MTFLCCTPQYPLWRKQCHPSFDGCTPTTVFMLFQECFMFYPILIFFGCIVAVSHNRYIQMEQTSWAQMINNPSSIQHGLVEAISSFSWRYNFFIKVFQDILCIRTTYFLNRRKPRSQSILRKLCKHPPAGARSSSWWANLLVVGL